jgi:tight adherence protein B
MILIAAIVLAFVSVAGIVYSVLTGFYPPMHARIRSHYLEVDKTLSGIFYTDYDAKLFVGLIYGGPVVALLAGIFILDSLIFGLFVAVVLYWLPSIILERIVRNRQETLEQQTSDVMTAFTACIRSGMTLEESIEEVATRMRPPVSQEFGLIKERIDAGQTVISALRAADKRLDLPRLSLVFKSIIVSQERGGKLATLMDQLSESTREIERVEERVKTETSGLRLSSRIMVFMPVIICGFLYFADPAQITMLFNTLIGNVILCIALALDIAAFRIMQKLIDLDV